MSNQIKGGRKPISAKPAAGAFSNTMFGDRMALDPEIVNDIKSKGQEHRFLDAKELYQNSGYHKNGWVPYKVPAELSAKLGLQSFKMGTDPDGVVRRGSLILGVRSVAASNQHRDFLQHRAKVYSREQHKLAKESVKEALAAGNVNTPVYAGEDEDE